MCTEASSLHKGNKQAKLSNKLF